MEKAKGFKMSKKDILKIVGLILSISTLVLMVIDHINENIDILTLTLYLLTVSLSCNLFIHGLKAKEENKKVRFFFYFILPITADILIMLFLVI